jgi:protein phosphatase
MTDGSEALEAAVLSEGGRRPLNEDAVLAAVLRDGAELVAVADGMGGYSAGEVASRRALEELRDALEEGLGLEAAVQAANRAVYAEASGNGHQHGMGTTLVAVLRRGGEYLVANVGDSRAYRVDGQGVRQLTVDHSFIAEAVRSGMLSAEEAEQSRWRNAVTRAVGTEPELEAVDCFGPFDATESHTVVLCTDGLYRVFPEARLAEALADAPPVDEAATSLVATAYELGSEDNISVAVLRFGAADPPEYVQRATRSRGKRHSARHRERRWTPVELAILSLGVAAVLGYLVMLALTF